MADEKVTLWGLERDVRTEVFDRAGELLADRYPEDTLTEIADSWVPIYNSDLAELLADNPGLAYLEDNIYAGEGDVDVFKILMWSVYEKLSQAAHEAWGEVEAAASGWVYGDTQERIDLAAEYGASIFAARRDEVPEAVLEGELND